MSPPSDTEEAGDSYPNLFYSNVELWEDDDDDDYDPLAPGEDDEDQFEEEDEGEEGEEGEFHDAEEGLDGVEIAFSLSGNQISLDIADDGNGEAEGSGNQPRHVYRIPSEQVIQLLRHSSLGRIFINNAAWRRRPAYSDSEESEPETGYSSLAPKKKRLRGRNAFQKVPSDEGRALMESGTFGTNDRREDTFKRKKKMAYRLMQRELGLGPRGAQQARDGLISQSLIPSSTADMIIHYDARCYSGQFSNDGNFFFSCAQDFKVRMYDTSNPYDWKYYKTVRYPYGQWTITDASLSPDNKFLAYSSIRSIVCLASTDPGDETEPWLLDFASSRTRRQLHSYAHFGIWSVRFSGDGRELVAGTGDNSVYVYDIERRQSILRLDGHNDDVNAVCFGDSQSPHILYSGSDDTTLKVWDRRSMADGREAGVFLGHTEGLTYVDSKGDGRYIISNGKDQTAKLWDLRMMMSKEKFDTVDPRRYTTDFEYRRDSYSEEDYRPHPHDCSVVTFRGHQVLKTLIRCHFAPPGSADGRYVYSGSYDGSVYIWNMDATLAGKINVLQATRDSRPRDAEQLAETYDFMDRSGSQWQTCVRDVSWHPTAPVIAATSWNGWGTALGTCTTHSWNDGLEDDEGEPKMSRRVNGQLQHEDELYHQETERRSRTTRRWRH